MYSEEPVQHSYVERVVNLIEPEANQIYNLSVDEATEVLLRQPAEVMRSIQGAFALVEIGRAHV